MIVTWIVITFVVLLVILVIAFAIYQTRYFAPLMAKLRKNDTDYALLKPTKLSIEQERFPVDVWTIPVQSDVTPSEMFGTMYQNEQKIRSLSDSNVLSLSDLSTSDWLKVRDFNRKNTPSLSSSSRVSSISEDFEEHYNLTQRRISDGVFEHLAKQGGKVSASDLRSHSLETLSEEGKSSKRVLVRQRKVSSAEKQYVQKKESGTITLQTEYSQEEKTLTVTITCVQIFQSTWNILNEINPIVKLYLKPGKRQKHYTSLKHKTLNPRYEESFVFHSFQDKELTQNILRLKVFNRKPLKRSKLLGQAQLLLASIVYSKEVRELPMYLHISELFTSMNIALCHEGTESKLLVTINKLKNLPKRKLFGTYVSATLFKANSIQQKRTSIRRMIHEPMVINEVLEFHIFTDVSAPLTNNSLVVTINTQSVVGKNEVIGHVVFCKTSPQESAAQQWRTVEEMPWSNHEAWHTIVSPDEFNYP